MQFINHTAFVLYDLAQSTFKLPEHKLFEMTSQKGAAMRASDEWDMFYKEMGKDSPCKEQSHEILPHQELVKILTA